jgi:Protein of unknown function (DUF3617)
MTPLVRLTSACIGAVAAAGDGAPARISEADSPVLYEVVTETGMPHLEENLRYTTTHEQRCLNREELLRAFPALKHESLRDCSLENMDRRSQVFSMRLLCTSAHGTTGRAEWRFGERRIVGALHVKLGGKNMTFYQRITATPLGECARK